MDRKEWYYYGRTKWVQEAEVVCRSHFLAHRGVEDTKKEETKNIHMFY
jgi:hypothetical protein